MAIDDRAAALEATRRLMRGTATRGEAKAALRALLRASADREGGTGSALGLRDLEPPAAPAAYDAAIDTAFSALGPIAERLAREERRAEAEVERIRAALGTARTDELLASIERPTWALAAGLRQASFETAPSDPGPAVTLAELAVAVAGRAPVDEVGPALAADLHAAALGQLGNALRVTADLPAAERALADAVDTLERGTGDPALESQVAGFGASLRREQRRFDDALRLARRAGRLARRAGDRRARARALVNEATIHYEAGDIAAASDAVEAALTLLDTEPEEGRLGLVARHNLIVYLDAQGRYREAAERLAETTRLAATLGHRHDQIRCRWAAARLAASRGDSEAAKTGLVEVGTAFQSGGADYDAALVALDLALLYAEEGRVTEVRELAAAMVPVFASRDIHREAQAALCLFQSAALAERAGVELVREVRNYLESARGRPQLRFRDG